MTEKKAVLIVGAGLFQVFCIREAQKLGLHVICTDQDERAPGAAMADEFFPIDTYNVEAHADLAFLLRDRNAFRLGGVVTCGADVAPSVAAAALAADLPGIPRDIASLTHNKFEVRKRLDDERLRIYSPRWRYLHKNDAWDEMRRDVATELQYPCIVKPLHERASRGVTVADNEEELLSALHKAWIFGKDCLVEECLVGTEHSSEIIFGNDGEILWWNVVDRYFDYSSKIPIELGHVNPTKLQEKDLTLISYMTLCAARALGVTWGPFKVDVILTREGPKILECTARLSGGMDSQWTSPATGRHPMRTLLQIACDLPIDRQKAMGEQDGYAAAVAMISDHPGMIQRFVDSEDVFWSFAPGHTFGMLQHNAERLGFVCVHGPGYDATWNKGREKAQRILENATARPPSSSFA